METIDSLKAIHGKSSNHRAEVLMSRWCGCFFCCRLFSPRAIRQWTDKGRTALCPWCKIDAIVPESGLNKPLSMEILESLRGRYFFWSEERKRSKWEDLFRLDEPDLTRDGGVEFAEKKRRGEYEGAIRNLKGSLSSDREVLSRIRKQVVRPVRYLLWGGGEVGSLFFAGIFRESVSLPLMAILLVGWAIVWLPEVSRWRGSWIAFQKTRMPGKSSRDCAVLPGSDMDYSSVGLNDLLYQESLDWARAVPELQEVWKAWGEDTKPIRRGNLRAFIGLAREIAGPHGPYAKEEVL